MLVRYGTRSGDNRVQAVSLGTWLRHRYLGAAALLPDDYSKETVIAHSTNYRRTRGTMHGVLLGLFPAYTENFSVATSRHDDELMLIQVLHFCCVIASACYCWCGATFCVFCAETGLLCIPTYAHL